MAGSRTLALTVGIVLALSACGGSDEGSSDSGSEQSDSSSAAVEATTLGALGLDVPSEIPADFPLPSDTVLVTINESGTAGERLDVIVGTSVSRAELEAMIEPYISGLENGRYADGSGAGSFGSVSASFFVATCEDCDVPPTTLTIAIPNS